MSSFAQAVRNDPSNGINRTYGENGMPELTVQGHGYVPLAYWEKCCRDMEQDMHNKFFKDCMAQARHENEPTKVVELFLMAMQTRDCRGGKGDRLPFYHMIQNLYSEYPVTTLSLVEIIPHYGYWKDLLLLVKHVNTYPKERVDYSPLISKCYSVMGNAIIEDHAKLKSGNNDISRVGTWAPREKKEFDKKYNAVSELIKVMFPDIVGEKLLGKDKKDVVHAWNHAKGLYRSMISDLSKHLAIPEALMCADRWEEIEFARVTSLCLSRNMKAFLNECKDGSTRFHDKENRIKCADNLIESLADLKGAQLFPHELVQKVLNDYNLSPRSKAVINAQWIQIRESIVKMAADMSAELGQSQFKLSGMIPMADVSGSMMGLPLEVCIGLSILLSEITHEKFRNLIQTFSSDCRWEDLSDCHNFVDKVQKLRKAHWGMSTNFLLAMQLIANVVEKNGLSPEETPDLVVFSDMQFDAAYKENSYYGRSSKPDSNWSTMFETITALFHELGMRMDGEPRTPPNIVFWNLRSNTVGYPVGATQPGVVTMSGYNPSLMKFFLSGQLQGEVEEIVDEETGEVFRVKNQITPLESFKKVMADSRLDLVRSKLALSQEGLLAKFGTGTDANDATLFE